MGDKDRDQLEELFRSKLQNFEADPAPDDWDAIVGRLPSRKIIPLWQNWRYMVATAAVILVIATGTFYLYTEDTMHAPLVQQAKQETEALDNQLKKEQSETIVIPNPLAKSESHTHDQSTEQMRVKAHSKSSSRNLLSEISGEDTLQILAKAVIQEKTELTILKENEQKESAIVKQQPDKNVSDGKVVEPIAESVINKRKFIADAGQPAKKRSEQPSKKWNLGLGSGSFTAGTGNTVNTYTFRNSLQTDKSLMFMNGASINSELPKTDIHHDTPITFGLAVSRQLNNRFALQTGLTFTLLSSDWKTNGTFHTQTKQKLYFVGLPLSVVYKIAEWNRFQFYVSAGTMAEINVSGKVKNKLFSDGIDLGTESEKIRMKEWLWSVNTKVGVSYPVFRFVNIFAEGGVAYFFDNGSSIETIRSEKPFNAGFNVGLRLGF